MLSRELRAAPARWSGSAGEPLTVPTLVGAMLVLVGVGLTQVRQFRLLLRANRTGQGIASERSAV